MAAIGPVPTLARWIRPGSALPDLTADSAAGVLAELAEGFARTLPGVSRADVLHGFSEREALGTTAIGNGFAIPHCRLAAVRELQIRLARHPQGVDFGAPDGQPVRVFFAVAAPQSGPSDHLEALRAIARLLREPERRARLLGAGGPAELLAIVETDPGNDGRGARSEVTADV